MSMFDEERKQMGLPLIGGSSPVSNGESIFANERARQNTTDYGTRSYTEEDSRFDQSNNMINALDSADGAYSNQVKADNEARATYQQRADEQALSDEAEMAQAQRTYADMPMSDATELPGRNLPVIGPIFRALDTVSENPVVQKVADIGRSLYTPGASLQNVGAFTGAVESGLARLAPRLGSTFGGRVAQEAIKEGAAGVPLGAGQSLASGNPDLQDAGKAGLIGGGLGAAGGVALPLLGRGIQAAESAAARGLGQAEARPSLGTAVDDFMRNVDNTASDVPGRNVQSYDASFMAQPGNDYADRYRFINRDQFNDTQALPDPIAQRRYQEAVNRRGTSQTSGDVIAPYGETPTFALPEGNYVQPQRLKVEANPDQYINRVMEQIKPIVNERMTPPLENPNELAKWVQQHGFSEASLNEVRRLPYEDLRTLANEIKSGLNVRDEAVKAARELGYDLPALLERQTPSVGSRMAQDAQARTAGVYPESLPNVRQPEGFNTSVSGQAAAPVTVAGRLKGTVRQAPAKTLSPMPKEAAVPQEKLRAARPITEAPKATGGMQTAPLQPVDLRQSSRLRTSVVAPKATDELKFAQTVRTSENTAEPLTRVLSDTPLTGSRTSDVLNRQQAEALIEKHGREGLYSKLLAKRMNFSSVENTAAQMLAKHYSSLGGEANLSRAIDLVSKTAKGGREMGQAIQALSQWNKLDAEGALLLGERQLNRGVRNTEDWQKLTPAQGAPITEAAQRIGKAQETRNLADEVLSIVTNKQAGEALTDAEKATIKQFQDQVKTINEKGKGILAKPKEGKANATIKEVSQIEPKARTRDQVVSFLDAKAEKARERLAKSRNVGILPDLNNPVTDYAIIGASHIAKGVVKLSDFTAAMVRDFGEAIKPHINEVFTKATNIFRKENGLPTVEELDRVVRNAVKNERFSTEEAAKLKAWAAEIGHMSDEFKVEATQDLQMAMKELGDSTLGQKISTIQTGAQLLNAVTVGRNVIGNAALVVSEKINKIAAVPIDYALSKLTGERTIQFMPKVQEKMLRNFMMGTESGWKGVSPTGTLDSYGIHPNVFGKNNPLRYISKSLGASMQGFDFAAYRVAYGDVLATYGEQLGKAQGLARAEIKQQMPKLIEQLDARIHELADKAGLYATFQDDTLLSQGAEMLKRGLNKITDLPAQKLVERGLLPKSLSTEGFGAGDIVLKYAKTPANLVMRAIDYSPIGFIRATMELAPLLFNRSKFNQFQATRALSRAITGTLGLTGMGYILADAGILTGSSSMDKDMRSIQEQSGQGAYKVNWSALGRFLQSGFDKDAAKYQKSDTLMDYAWLQPAAISVAMGVNAQKAVNDKKNDPNISGWQVAGKALLGGLQTILENPMVQGISQIVDAGSDIIKKQDATKLKGIGKGVPATFIPTLLNQARTATDNSQRETFDKNIFTEIGNLMKNKVPGLSNTLPVSFDSLGNAREKIQGGQADTVGQYLTAFFSPAKMTEYQVSPEAKIVLDLMNQSGDQNVLPRISNRYIHISQGNNQKDLRVDLTAEQYSQLQENAGRLVTKKLAEKAEYLSNDSISLKNKVERVKSILTDVGKKAREDIGIQMGYKKKDIKS